MELSLTAIVAIIGITLTLLGVFGGIVAGFVRLETKVNGHDKDIVELYRHSEDKTVHHDGAELDRRFSVIDTVMLEIKKGIDKINERFDRFLSK